MWFRGVRPCRVHRGCEGIRQSPVNRQSSHFTLTSVHFQVSRPLCSYCTFTIEMTAKNNSSDPYINRKEGRKNKYVLVFFYYFIFYFIKNFYQYDFFEHIAAGQNPARTKTASKTWVASVGLFWINKIVDAVCQWLLCSVCFHYLNSNGRTKAGGNAGKLRQKNRNVMRQAQRLTLKCTLD